MGWQAGEGVPLDETRQEIGSASDESSSTEGEGRERGGNGAHCAIQPDILVACIPSRRKFEGKHA